MEKQRRQTVAAISDWWKEFATRILDIEALFSGKKQWDLAAWMQETLQPINPHLMWEYGPGLESGHRLVVTPEHRFGLRPLVDEILRQAPKIKDWSFFGS